MTDLQKEFESTGYTSWINADLYPDGKIYTQEYTQWLERQVLALRQPLTSVSLPTDEQILKQANKYDIKDMNDAITRIRGFIVGATWMRDQAITANVKILAQLRFKTTKL